MRRWMVGGVVGGVGALVWIVSCVGDSTVIPAGQDGGVCLTNGTCDQGLVCIIEGSSTKCVPPGADGGVDAPASDAPKGDGNSGDVANDAPADAPRSCDADANGPANATMLCNTPNGTSVTCYNTGDAALSCSTYAAGGCEGGTFQAACLSNGGFKCCLTGASWVDAACSPTLDLSKASSYLPSNGICGGFVMCDGGPQCVAKDAGTTCEPVAVSGVPALATTIVGVCQ